MVQSEEISNLLKKLNHDTEHEGLLQSLKDDLYNSLMQLTNNR
jgi:hypothetical protein